MTPAAAHAVRRVVLQCGQVEVAVVLEQLQVGTTAVETLLEANFVLHHKISAFLEVHDGRQFRSHSVVLCLFGQYERLYMQHFASVKIAEMGAGTLSFL